MSDFEFTQFEEEQIILLALDNPDFFYRIARFMEPKYFEVDQNQYIMATYIDYYKDYDDVPTREVLKNIIYKELRSDSELADPVIEILNKEIDYRNSRYIRNLVVKWARVKQLSELYDEDVMESIRDGDVSKIDNIIDKATAISDVAIRPFRFFEDLDELFIEDEKEHFTCGFSRIDKLIHDGRGPARKEAFIWIAPTGVGKSIMLVNTSVANVLDGKNVLHVTLENSEKITGHRYLGAFTEMAIANRSIKENQMKEKLNKIKLSEDSGDLFITYFPTDSITVREIELTVTELRRHYSFNPDVIVVDYLECLLSKESVKNKEEYSKQKSVSSELRWLGSITDTMIFSASQTNRAGASSSDKNDDDGGNLINLDKIAESFGKAMPLDYVVSINQSQSQYQGDSNEGSHISNVKLFFAKNRNGPKYKVINAKINYAIMKAFQDQIADG